MDEVDFASMTYMYMYMYKIHMAVLAQIIYRFQGNKFFGVFMLLNSRVCTHVNLHVNCVHFVTHNCP